MTFASVISVELFRAHKRGYNVVFYAELKLTADLASGKDFCAFKAPYRPLNTYVIIPLRSGNPPYAETSTLWVQDSGRAILYGAIASGTRIFLAGSFAF